MFLPFCQNIACSQLFILSQWQSLHFSSKLSNVFHNWTQVFPPHFHWDCGPLLFCIDLQVLEVGRLPCNHPGLQFTPQILNWNQVWTGLVTPKQYYIDIVLCQTFLDHFCSVFGLLSSWKVHCNVITLQ